MWAAVMAEAAHDRPLRHAGAGRARRQRRRTNPVVDGQLVPRERKKTAKRRGRDESAATPSPRARRPRRAVNYDDSEPDEDEEDLELGPPDADDGWD